MIDYKMRVWDDCCQAGCNTASTCMCALAEDMAEEIERLREALSLISTHPVERSKQWEIGAREMQKLARLSLGEKE